MHSEPKVDFDALFGFARTNFTLGGVNDFCPFADDEAVEKRFKTGREGFYGWIGIGGTNFQWNPELNIGFAYTPTRIPYYDLFNEVIGQLQQEVVDCVRCL